MRVIVLIIDGLGIGEMADVWQVRPQDCGTNTLVHVAQANNGLSLPNLSQLGLGNLCSAIGIEPMGIKPVGNGALGSYGICQLQHSGADSFMGHQELMGTIPPPPKNQIMRDVGQQVKVALAAQGHDVVPLVAGLSCLLVDDTAVVHDNMETDPGININITANLDKIRFAALNKLGDIVRDIVDVARVIVVGGRGYSVADMRQNLKQHPNGAVGLDTPGLGVYDEWFQVRHIGKGIPIEAQVPHLVKQQSLPVVLIGKAADVITCPGSKLLPMVDTRQVLQLVQREFSAMKAGLVIANVQETDLAGHEQNAPRWAKLLEIIDGAIGQLMALFQPDDVLIITGDHGNDPTSGRSDHTREMTPFLLYSPSHPPRNLGKRATLADVGATVTDLFGAGMPQDGRSALELVR